MISSLAKVSFHYKYSKFSKISVPQPTAGLLTTAEHVVKYCRDQPMHREVVQVKFLRARTLYRAYYHVTNSMVLEDGPGREREVDTLPGTVSLYHTVILRTVQHSRVYTMYKPYTDQVHTTYLLNCHKGVTSWKQAWSTGHPYELLVRMGTCCCSFCLADDFQNCSIKVIV